MMAHLPHPYEECPPFWSGGPSPGGYYNFPAAAPNKTGSQAATNPTTRSQYPITTGTSVFGLRFKDGIVIAADTMGSYGSLARFPNLMRVIKVNETTVIASSGDIADFQYLNEIIERKQMEEDLKGGGVNMRPKALHSWLTRVLYNRRSKFDPLWNTIVVGGVQEGKPFMGAVDMIGTAWTGDFVSTGLGAHFAIPIMTEALEKYGGADNLSQEEAVEIVQKCVRVCYLRDCRATSKYHMGVVSKDGSKVEGPLVIDSNWEIARYVRGYE